MFLNNEVKSARCPLMLYWVAAFRTRHRPKMEVAPFKHNGWLIAERLQVATELVQRDTSLDCHGEIGFVDGKDLVHLFVRQNNITTDEAWRDGVHGSNDFDFRILSIGIFDNCLNFADAAGFFELGVRDVELDLVVPVDKLRHFGCTKESD